MGSGQEQVRQHGEGGGERSQTEGWPGPRGGFGSAVGRREEGTGAAGRGGQKLGAGFREGCFVSSPGAALPRFALVPPAL